MTTMTAHQLVDWITIKIFGWIFVAYLLVAQDASFFFYDSWGVSQGFQEDEAHVTAIGVAYNKGFCFADLIWYTPLFVIGLLSYERHHFGVVALSGAFAVTMYWPLVGICQDMVAKRSQLDEWKADTDAYYIVLPIFMTWSLWGLWRLSTLVRPPYLGQQLQQHYEEIPQ